MDLQMVKFLIWKGHFLTTKEAHSKRFCLLSQKLLSNNADSMVILKTSMFKHHTLQMDSKKLAINFNLLIVKVVDTYTTKVSAWKFPRGFNFSVDNCEKH